MGWAKVAVAVWALATLLATRWFLRRTTLRLWEWVAAFLLAVPVALGWPGCLAACERTTELLRRGAAVNDPVRPPARL